MGGGVERGKTDTDKDRDRTDDNGSHGKKVESHREPERKRKGNAGGRGWEL